MSPSHGWQIFPSKVNLGLATGGAFVASVRTSPLGATTQLFML
jgi:hypothetical protein